GLDLHRRVGPHRQMEGRSRSSGGPLVPGRAAGRGEKVEVGTEEPTTEDHKMTTYESHKATVEARKAVASSTAPVSRHETAMHQYLAATAHLSEPASRGPVP